MADAEGLEDDRDTSLPSSALSPAEYRTYRGLVNDLLHNTLNNKVSLYSVLEFLSSFNRVTQSVAQQVFSLFISLIRLSRLSLARSKGSLLGKVIFML
jgi:hypothetical protein